MLYKNRNEIEVVIAIDTNNSSPNAFWAATKAKGDHSVILSPSRMHRHQIPHSFTHSPPSIPLLRSVIPSSEVSDTLKAVIIAGSKFRLLSHHHHHSPTPIHHCPFQLLQPPGWNFLPHASPKAAIPHSLKGGLTYTYMMVIVHLYNKCISNHVLRVSDWFLNGNQSYWIWYYHDWR